MSAWTVADVAELTRFSDDTVYRMARGGEVPAKKVRGRWRFDPEEVRSWWASLTPSPETRRRRLALARRRAEAAAR